MSAGRPVQPLIVVPDEACGEAMLALSPAQRAFVYALVHFGCNAAEAARKSGYSNVKKGVAKVTAYRLVHTPAIVAAIQEEARKVMATEGPRSIKTLIELRDDKKGEAKDRLKAAVELLNRGGLNAVSEGHIRVDHHVRLTDAQKDARIISLAKELGLTSSETQKLLVDPSKVIDVEFEEVPAPSCEGIEDIL